MIKKEIRKIIREELEEILEIKKLTFEVISNFPDYEPTNVTRRYQDKYDLDIIWKLLTDNRHNSGYVHVSGVDYILITPHNEKDVEIELHELGHAMHSKIGKDFSYNELQRLIQALGDKYGYYLDEKDWLELDGNAIYIGDRGQGRSGIKEFIAEMFKWWCLDKFETQEIIDICIKLFGK